ncbi:MAG: long-chain fatty acid--CoA ligase, partial [Alphaproteobacteria bacterium]|nr:long-chain fatty acid--CoA ligase [Alphaproteobacteria bacterium]
MFGLMQDWPLLIHRVIDYAATQHPHRAVISRAVEGPMRRTTYRDVKLRALKLAQRLARDGVKLGDRIGTLAWNTDRHLESWYGITGIGAIYHTLNPRLFEDQLIYIANHAGDKMIFLDLTFVPLAE